MSSKKLAFLGLGVMGYPMAGHLARAGHAVTVFNRTPAKATAWVAQYGGSSAATPADAARDADIVMMCVGNDSDVREVATGALTAMRRGAIIVDHTTASAKVAREVHAAAASRGVAADHDRQFAVLRARLSARHRSVEEPDAASRRRRVDLARHLR